MPLIISSLVSIALCIMMCFSGNEPPCWVVITVSFLFGISIYMLCDYLKED